MRSDEVPRIRIGTATWAIPRAVADCFPQHGSGLERYAATFDSVEINSTFYKPHRADTFLRWRDSTPADFRFAVKLARQITHVSRLVDIERPLTTFVADVGHLGSKLGPLLVQLPPSLPLSAPDHEASLAVLRTLWSGDVALEPRHLTWFTPEADAMLRTFRIARVAADPALHPEAGHPGGWPGFAYWRWHGSPKVYYSSYDDDRLGRLAQNLRRCGADTWCVFDNTASGAAASNALQLGQQLNDGGPGAP